MEIAETEIPLQQKQVILYNGEPRLKVTKMLDGYYQWSTKKNGMMQHTLYSVMEAQIEESGHRFFVVIEQYKEDENENYAIKY